jgi:dihydroorotate dehydrogenase (NAD+) catalytic subunit
MALVQVSEVAARVDIPVVGMGGVQTGRHARDLRDAGATVVGVGTESFRDPLAGSRIAAELAALDQVPVRAGSPAPGVEVA